MPSISLETFPVCHMNVDTFKSKYASHFQKNKLSFNFIPAELSLISLLENNIKFNLKFKDTES